jgi:hypothetical protein
MQKNLCPELIDGVLLVGDLFPWHRPLLFRNKDQNVCGSTCKKSFHADRCRGIDVHAGRRQPSDIRANKLVPRFVRTTLNYHILEVNKMKTAIIEMC